jgi:ATP-dependent RNA helicase DDX47/RRP3
VGRTARAGRAGKSVTLVTQYDVELFQRIENLIGKQLPVYKTQDDEVMHLQERVAEAQRLSKIQIKEMDEKKKQNGKFKRKGAEAGSENEDKLDTEESAGFKKRLQHKNNKKQNKNKKFKSK